MSNTRLDTPDKGPGKKPGADAVRRAASRFARSLQKLSSGTPSNMQKTSERIDNDALWVDQIANILVTLKHVNAVQTAQLNAIANTAKAIEVAARTPRQYLRERSGEGEKFFGTLSQGMQSIVDFSSQAIHHATGAGHRIFLLLTSRLGEQGREDEARKLEELVVQRTINVPETFWQAIECDNNIARELRRHYPEFYRSVKGIIRPDVAGQQVVLRKEEALSGPFSNTDTRVQGSGRIGKSKRKAATMGDDNPDTVMPSSPRC